jgi:hypothetical protein
MSTILPTTVVQPRDCCRGPRKTYAAFLELVAGNRWSTGVLSGLPLYYIVSMMAVYANSYASSVLAGGSYSFMGALIAAWLLAMLCLWRVWPNGLTGSLFILKALGYWSLVSFLILLFYGIRLFPLEVTTYLSAMLLPEIVLLLLTADIVRTARTRLYTELETASSVKAAATTVDTSYTV